MNFLLYWLARLLLFPFQHLPLAMVARIGRSCGALAYAIDGRHRKVAILNLTESFGKERSEAEIKALARENFCRIGENVLSAIRTANMTDAEIREILEFTGHDPKAPPVSRVLAIGHFGNFELYARANLFAPGVQMATTYRGLKQAGLNRLMQEFRRRSGCLFFERRTEAAALKAAMARPGLWLGLLADQHAGDGGLRLPFLGRECSTSAAPAVFALRYDCPLHTGFCHRVAPGRWRLECGGEIPTRVNGRARPVEEITRDMNRAFEMAVRRDPANWFWV
ncbi:MAG TPA: hypothetical protein VHH73_03875, partial [Verrucomicrobiae bacterium]|nr:hypothetical protein [Verrucomicrobiae bacterium]